MNKNVFLGQYVVSTQGRDKGCTYVVCNIINEKEVQVANGTTKTLLKPKKKKVCHLHLTPFGCEEITNKLKSNIKINDQMVYHALHEYSKQNKEAN